jgi:outer membrane lipoprotein SlyB
MKKVLMMVLCAASAVTLPSCAGVGNLNQVSPNSIGSVGQVIPGTVIAARNVTIEASSTSKNIGTGIGAALGAGAGSLLGSGSGQVVSTVGFGVVGALAGRGLASANTQQGQVLTIKADGKNGATYSVTQPVYGEIGYIPVGTHGMLQLGSQGKFLPDGM